MSGVSFRYTDGGRTELQLFTREAKAGDNVVVPQGNWSGGMLLVGASFPRLLERMPVNNPGATVELGVGLWAWPMPMDFDGDGDLGIWWWLVPTSLTTASTISENPTAGGDESDAGVQERPVAQQGAVQRAGQAT